MLHHLRHQFAHVRYDLADCHVGQGGNWSKLHLANPSLPRIWNKDCGSVFSHINLRFNVSNFICLGSVCKAITSANIYRKSLKKRITKSGQAETKWKKHKYENVLRFLSGYFQERDNIWNISVEDRKKKKKTSKKSAKTLILKNQTKNVSHITKGIRTTLHFSSLILVPCQVLQHRERNDMSTSRNSCADTYEVSSEAKQNEACNPLRRPMLSTLFWSDLLRP
jgi:hypothetical protein